MKAFVAYATPLKDEKGQAQVFCERLFQAFGHKGYLEAGATLEDRLTKKGGKGKKFIDLMWKPIVLIEMKSAGEKLNLHYQQAFDYWIAAVPNRPRYVILCNFKEFWIYDFDRQLDEPVDKVKLVELPQRYTALNFLFPESPEPIFNNDREEVSRKPLTRWRNSIGVWSRDLRRKCRANRLSGSSSSCSLRCSRKTWTSFRPPPSPRSSTIAWRRANPLMTCLAAYSAK